MDEIDVNINFLYLLPECSDFLSNHGLADKEN